MSSSPVALLAEFFTLRGARAAASALDASKRSELAAELQIVKQRCDAAEALWSAGHSAEALRLAVDSVRSLEASSATFMGDAGADAEKPVLARAATSLGRSRLVSPAEALAKDLADRALPTLDANVAKADVELYERILEVRDPILTSLSERTMTERHLKLRAAARTAVAAVGTLAVAGIGYVVMRGPTGDHARASASFSDAPEYQPSRAIDGLPETAWLLPDQSAGWIEVTYNPPRSAQRVRVLNTANMPYLDRAALEYEVQAFSGSNVVFTQQSAFTFSPSPEWVNHDIGSTQTIDRVRVNVRTWHNNGAGIAEVALE